MIHAHTTLDIARPPGDVFAMLDDPRRVPDWLSQCAELSVVPGGPMRAGSKLLYRYRDGGPRTGTMDGEVTAYEKDRRLEMHYSDKMFELDIVFELAPAGAGTHLDHRVAMAPKGIAKLMAPMIRGATRKQIEKDTARLKALLESDRA
jgi:uncharacterized protein YndB with AHSA1/START domain